MGYYSNTTIVMNKEDFTEFISRGLADSSPDIVRHLVEYGQYKTATVDGNEYAVCQWYDVKWYEGTFEEIDFVMDYINSLDSFLYYRVGEEHNDVEERFRGDDYALYDCIDIIPITVNAYGEEIDREKLFEEIGGTQQ